MPSAAHGSPNSHLRSPAARCQRPGGRRRRHTNPDQSPGSFPPKPEPLPTKGEVQAGFLADAFRAKGVHVGVGRTPAGDIDFLYEDHAILVRDAYVEQVRGIVGRSEDTHEQDDGFIDGVTLLSLDGADITDVSAAIDAIAGRLGVGVATPNHVLSICPGDFCPATDPAEAAPVALPDP